MIPVTMLGALAFPVLIHAADPQAPASKSAYPLTTCVVSGEKLGGDMGKPFVFTYKDPKKPNDAGREVQFCCSNCVKDFNADPAKYLKKIDAAAAKARK